MRECTRARLILILTIVFRQRMREERRHCGEHRGWIDGSSARLIAHRERWPGMGVPDACGALRSESGTGCRTSSSDHACVRTAGSTNSPEGEAVDDLGAGELGDEGARQQELA